MSADKELPIGNLPPEGFVVGCRGDKIAIMALGCELTREQALNLAGWLVALVDPGGDEFQKYLTAICKT